MNMPLEGIKVVEQGTFITGPAASVLLADLGAEVVKVERPVHGDPFRGPGLYSAHYQTYNRNKKSIALDTRNEDDLAIFDDLIADCDVYIQNFRPGVSKQLFVDAERLRAINPKLIYCAISGFGPDGPNAQRACFDTVAQAASGFLNLMLDDAEPRVMGPALADSLTGFYAAYGVLGALNKRHVTGEGCTVEVSMLEAMSHFNIDAYTHYFSEGQLMHPFSRPSASNAFVLDCRDGKRVALHLSTPEKFWRGLVNATGRSAQFEAAGYMERERRVNDSTGLIALLRAVFLERDRAEWCGLLEQHDVPFAPVYNAQEALTDPQVEHLQMQITGYHPNRGEFRTIRSPLTYDGVRVTQVVPPPELDQDRDAILAGRNR